MRAHRVENDARGALPALLRQQRDFQCAEGIGGSSKRPVPMRPVDHAVPAGVRQDHPLGQLPEHERHGKCPPDSDVGFGGIDDGERRIQVLVEMRPVEVKCRRGIMLHELRPDGLERLGKKLRPQFRAGAKCDKFEHVRLLANG